MSNDIKPDKSLILTEDDHIRAYVHPTRISILKHLAREKSTVSGTAKKLGVHPANLTHHFKKLEKSGLIKLVEKKDIGKNIEKYYRAAAYNYIVQSDRKSIANKKALALSILRDDLSATINSLRQNDSRAVLAFLECVRLSPENIEAFTTKLRKLAEEFKKGHSKKGISYSLNLSLYPGETEITEFHENIIIE